MKNPTHEYLIDTKQETISSRTGIGSLGFYSIMFFPLELLSEHEYDMLGMSFMLAAQEMLREGEYEQENE